MSHNHESIKRKIIQKQIDDETVKEKQYTPNINKMNLYFKLDDKEPLFSESDGYSSFLSYLTKTEYELTYRTNSVVCDRFKNISEKYNIKDRKEVDYREIFLHGSNENIENVFVVRLSEKYEYLTSFTSKDYWNYFLYDLEQAIEQYNFKIYTENKISDLTLIIQSLGVECLELIKKIKVENDPFLKSNLQNELNGKFDYKMYLDLTLIIQSLGVECLELIKKIKVENDPFLKSNLQNELNGKFDYKMYLDLKLQQMETENLDDAVTTPNWHIMIPKINYYDLIKKFELKSIEDVEILEVPFERN